MAFVVAARRTHAVMYPVTLSPRHSVVVILLFFSLTNSRNCRTCIWRQTRPPVSTERPAYLEGAGYVLSLEIRCDDWGLSLFSRVPLRSWESVVKL